MRDRASHYSPHFILNLELLHFLLITFVDNFKQEAVLAKEKSSLKDNFKLCVNFFKVIHINDD